MAAPTDLRPAGGTDRDLASIQEARELARRARRAQGHMGELSQERIDAIVDAMAAAVTPQAETLARLAVEETGFGVVADKVQKNLFSSELVYRFIRPMRTVGVVNRIEEVAPHEPRHIVGRRHVHDERVMCRPSLRFEQPTHGRHVERRPPPVV